MEQCGVLHFGGTNRAASNGSHVAQSQHLLPASHRTYERSVVAGLADEEAAYIMSRGKSGRCLRAKRRRDVIVHSTAAAMSPFRDETTFLPARPPPAVAGASTDTIGQRAVGISGAPGTAGARER